MMDTWSKKKFQQEEWVQQAGEVGTDAVGNANDEKTLEYFVVCKEVDTRMQLVEVTLSYSRTYQ